MTTSTDSTRLASVLFEEAMAGRFGNMIEAYFDKTFRNDYDDRTFYSKILKEEGNEAAEARLLEWAKHNHDQRVADAIAPIVLSLSSLAEIDHRNISVKRFGKTDHSIFPFHYRTSSETYAIAIANPDVPGCGCSQAKGADMFSPWGELGITSFVVVIDPLDPANNSLVLMLPLRDNKKGSDNRHGFVALTMSRNGEMRSDLKEMYFYQGAAEHVAFGGDNPFGVRFASGETPVNMSASPAHRSSSHRAWAILLSICRMSPTS